MKKLISTRFLGVLALLCSSASMAATVVVTPSNANPNAGDTFQLIITGAAFPDTIGATLGLTFNPNVRVDSITALAPSPFTGGIAGAPNPFPSNSEFTLLAPTSGALPNGSFEAFRINMTALSDGLANIVLVDNGVTRAWADANFGVIPVQYTQANVCVGQGPACHPVVPVPAAVWLFMSALGSFAGLKRLRRQ